MGKLLKKKVMFVLCRYYLMIKGKGIIDDVEHSKLTVTSAQFCCVYARIYYFTWNLWKKIIFRKIVTNLRDWTFEFHVSELYLILIP